VFFGKVFVLTSIFNHHPLLHVDTKMKNVFLAIMLLGGSIATSAQKAEIIKAEQLQHLLSKPTDKVRVINFWATWCGPCVKELPLFEKLNAEASETVEVILVSMDLVLDPNPEKVYKFIQRKNLQSRVLLLNEQEPNIDGIEKEWSGALPATLILNNKTGSKKFIGRELKEGELEKVISEIQ
jgi:thiol-disulfide isomerase/thioredoxin